jgi:two-component system NtrC family sensor kinase
MSASADPADFLERHKAERMATAARLAVMVAHDLRTPLASILLNLDVLGDRWRELPGEEVQSCIQESWQAAQQLRVVIEGMLDMVRVGPQPAREISLREVLLRVLGLVRPLARARGHAITIELGDDAASVRGNLVTVEQIFLNLLLNAAEASRSPLSIQVSSRRVGGLIEVRVADDGPGIPAEHRARLFQTAFTTKPNGTGMGLDIARDAARLSGGSLELEETAVGACFVARLPSAR